MAEGPIYRTDPRGEQRPAAAFEGDLRDLAAYEATGGYEQLKRAVETMTGEQIVEAISASGLRGRGGAGFPTGRKASFLAPAEPRYIVVNADESEPGTFKDRELILRNPHALLEGILIMSWAIERGRRRFVYIRGEYLTEYEVLRAALPQARERGLVGPSCRLGLRRRDRPAPRRRRLHLRRGDGAALVAQRLPRPADAPSRRSRPSPARSSGRRC